MKKIFWTSIVRIALFGIFLLYMKWFNQPLAGWFSDFIVKSEESHIVEIIEENSEMTWDIVEEENISQDIEINPLNENIDKNWSQLFEQLDRIESSIVQNDTIENNINTWATQEEMFDEFKIRYEKNKK